MAYNIPKPITVTTTQFDVLVGDAGNAISSVGPGSAGQVLQSKGNAANPAYSTATYPSTATSAGKILRADGTNWVATTATYPDTAGTSGNILQSDGTNWSSVTPSNGLGYAQLVGMGNDNSNLVDSTTYFISQARMQTYTASGNSATRLYVPKDGTITKVYGTVTVAGTLGSSEACSIILRKNNTSDTTITSSLTLAAADNTFNATISVAVVAGDYYEIKFVSPAWATNPTVVGISLTVYIA